MTLLFYTRLFRDKARRDCRELHQLCSDSALTFPQRALMPFEKAVRLCRTWPYQSKSRRDHCMWLRSSRVQVRKFFRKLEAPAGQAAPPSHNIFGADTDLTSRQCLRRGIDRKSTRLNSSHVEISYAVFCLKK